MTDAVSWRVPDVSLERGCRLEEALTTGYGDFEAYGCHALEGVQALVEMRRGGETGVARVETVSGEKIWETARTGRWSRELFEAALDIAPRYKPGDPEKLLRPNSAWYLIEYRDGLRATIAMTTGVLYAAMLSLAEGRPIDTPYLDVRYEPTDWPHTPRAPPLPGRSDKGSIPAQAKPKSRDPPTEDYHCVVAPAGFLLFLPGLPAKGTSIWATVESQAKSLSSPERDRESEKPRRSCSLEKGVRRIGGRPSSKR